MELPFLLDLLKPITKPLLLPVVLLALLKPELVPMEFFLEVIPNPLALYPFALVPDPMELPFLLDLPRHTTTLLLWVVVNAAILKREPVPTEYSVDLLPFLMPLAL